MSFVFVKRGQITILVVLALVVLFTFGFLLYSVSIIQKQKMITQVNSQIQDYLNSNSVNIYVTSCLDAVADEAVIRASLQGGIINFSGSIYGQDYVTVNNTIYNRTVNVSIAVKPNTPCLIYVNTPPEYPYKNTAIFPSTILKSIYRYSDCYYNGSFMPYSGFFGLNNLTKLCSWNGSNKPQPAGSPFAQRTCLTEGYDDFSINSSIQQNIEKFISDEMIKCTNFSELQQRTASSNITLTNSPTTKIIFGDNGVSIKLEYPITVLIRNQQPITQMVEFGVEKNVALKDIYDLAVFSIKYDVSDATYDIVNDKTMTLTRLNLPDYNITKIRNVDKNNTDLIIIIDNRSFVAGHPLIFQFAIKNRRPALDYLHYTTDPRFDVVGLTNETIILRPQGYDPDEDFVRYTYNLWKEDYDDLYKFSDPKCSNATSIDYVIENCSVRNNAVTPHAWTKSLEFNLTQQNASYRTTLNDTGFHIVRITTWDDSVQQLKDWQDIRILILDLPKVVISGANPYDDVLPRDAASGEDPYTLNGSASTVGSSGWIAGSFFTSFVWNDSSKEFFKQKNIIGNPDDKLLKLPEEINLTSLTIMNIPKKVFILYVNPPSKIHNITLKATTNLGLVNTGIIPVNVSQCLPHRSSDSSYPYNSGDAFFANHTCCTDAKTFAPISRVCYKDIIWGGLGSFINFSSAPGLLDKPTGANYKEFVLNVPIVGGVLSLAKPYDNDIYRREFMRNCSSDRGNVCTGKAVDIKTRTFACSDVNVGVTSNERCQGPPVDNTGHFISTAYGNPVTYCQNYSTGNTFEKYAYGGTGSCSGGAICVNVNSLTGTGTPNPVGSFSCGLFCDGKGGCTNVTLSNCVCSSAGFGGCLFNSASPQCNNIVWPGSTNNSIPIYSSVGGEGCKAGNSNYLDECYACGFRDRLNTTCGYTPVPQNAITGCTGNVACNGLHPQNAALNFMGDPALGFNNAYCNTNCQLTTCAGNFAYNTAGRGSCRTSCSNINDVECASLHHCCLPPRFGSAGCNAGNVGKCV